MKYDECGSPAEKPKPYMVHRTMPALCRAVYQAIALMKALRAHHHNGSYPKSSSATLAIALLACMTRESKKWSLDDESTYRTSQQIGLHLRTGLASTTPNPVLQRRPGEAPLVLQVEFGRALDSIAAPFLNIMRFVKLPRWDRI